MAKFTITLSIGLVGCEREVDIEIPDEDIEGMSDEEVSRVVDEWARDEVDNMIEWGWTRAED